MAVTSVDRPGEFFKLTITLENTPEEIERLANRGEAFDRELKIAFTNFIFEVHKYLLRVTPIDTGELRGGWLAYLDAHSIDYSRQVTDTSIAEKAPGREYHITPDGIQLGRGFSQYEVPIPTDVTIVNSVPHGIYLEDGTSKIPARNFVGLTRYKAEFLYEKLMKDWLSKIEGVNEIVPADAPPEIQV